LRDYANVLRWRTVPEQNPLGFVSCKGRTGYRLVSHPLHFICSVFAIKRRKAAFGRPLEFGQGP
jgi:hypothetical protein